MRRERDGRRRPQDRRSIVPDLVEQLVDRAPAGVERGDHPSLAVTAVLEVLADLRARILDNGAVPWAQRRQIHPLQALQRREIA